MKLSFTHIVLFIAVLCLKSIAAKAQNQQEILQSYIVDDHALEACSLNTRQYLSVFYKALNYQWAWLNSEDSIRRTALLQALKNSSDLGLQETDYPSGYIESVFTQKIRLLTTSDSLGRVIFYQDVYEKFSWMKLRE